VASTPRSLLEDIVDALNAEGLARGRIGLCSPFRGSNQLGSRLPHATIEKATVDDGAGIARTLLERVRALKSPWEIDRLQQAQRAADIGMRTFMQEVKSGRRHVEAQSLAETAAVTAGADAGLSIMNSGSQPWMWWHYQGDRRFPDDAIVSLEVNARAAGYCAQLARSGILGRGSGAQARMLEVAEQSVTAMVDALRPGATGGDVWRAGMAPLRVAGLPAWGRLGHGMGLAMDEGIAIIEKDDTPLMSGMSVALHASVWDEHLQESVLLGEQYVITAAGAKLLSETVPARDLAPAGAD